jgi:hypothetical protein
MSDEGEDNRTLFRIGVALNVVMLLLIILVVI